MTKINLTNRSIKAKPFAGQPGAPVDKDGKPLAQYLARDKHLKGFFCVIGRNSKSWTVQYDLPSTLGKRRSSRRALGQFPDLDASEARKLAEDYLGGIKTKRIVATKGHVTLTDAWQHYQTFMRNKGRSPKSFEQYRGVYKNHLAQWGDLTLRELVASRQAVAAYHGKLGATRPGAANSMAKLLSAIYRRAVKAQLEDDLPDRSPTAAVELFEEHRRETAMTFDELRDWERQRLALGCPIRRAFHKFMILSGQRPNAVRQMKWSWVDLEAGTILFPANVMKGRKPFLLPCSAAMLECLTDAREAGMILFPERVGEFVFTANSASGHLMNAKENRETLSKFGGDLRQGWVDTAKSIGLDGYIARRLLDHVNGDSHDGYARSNIAQPYLFEAQEQMTARLLEGLNRVSE